MYFNSGMAKFFLVQKVVGLEYSISIFIFFILNLFLIVQNDFIRCFKVEPFVLVSIFKGIFVPLLFYLGNKFDFKMYLYPSVFVMVISILWSGFIARVIIVNENLNIKNPI
ncbi:putative membrane protein [Vibrio mimicus]|nr:putative membrane protein [Vibrio mimicus]